MKNLVYYDVLEKSKRMLLEDKIFLIYKLMEIINNEIDEAVEAIKNKENLMLSPSVNHKTSMYIDKYAESLIKLEVRKDNEKMILEEKYFNYILDQIKLIALEDKLTLVYNLMENVKTIIDIIEMQGNQKEGISINKNMLSKALKFLQIYHLSIEKAHALENDLGVILDLEDSSSAILR